MGERRRSGAGTEWRCVHFFTSRVVRRKYRRLLRRWHDEKSCRRGRKRRSRRAAKARQREGLGMRRSGQVYARWWGRVGRGPSIVQTVWRVSPIRALLGWKIETVGCETIIREVIQVLSEGRADMAAEGDDGVHSLLSVWATTGGRVKALRRQRGRHRGKR